jgi:PIN domain nuclease of toxin-antitoxin system
MKVLLDTHTFTWWESNSAVLVSADPLFAHYPVNVVW